MTFKFMRTNLIFKSLNMSVHTNDKYNSEQIKLQDRLII